MKSKILFTLMVLLSMGMLNAQLSQTGTLSGTIVAEDGSAIPGVTVDVRSPAIVLEKMTTVSNEEGQFRMRNLPPGTYELTFSLEGMKTVVRKGIVIGVGNNTSISVAMEFGALTENIEVSGKAPTIDVQATSKTTNISASMIQAIPTRNRSLAGIFALAPGVQNGVAHGSGERNNSWNVDGVTINDPVVGSEGNSPVPEVLQEVAVTIGGVGADQASSGGAIINAVTKSGGNDFSGSASVYYNHESFNGDNTTGTPLEGSASGDKFNFNPSLTLGGPVIKNKLWFIVSYTQTSRETYVPGYPYDQATEIPFDQKEPYGYAKLTYQPGPNDKLYLSYSYSDNILNHRGATLDYVESATWKQDSVSHGFNFDWSHTFNNSFFGNLKIASSPVNFTLNRKNDNPIYYDNVTEKYLPGSSAGYTDVNKRSRLQFQTDFTLFIDNFIGQHEWKAGVEYSSTMNDRGFHMGGKESALQAGFKLLELDYNDGEADWAYWYKDTVMKRAVNYLYTYIQDTWSPTQKLTLTLGVRFESSRGIIPAQNETSIGYFLPSFRGTDYPLQDAVPEDLTVMKWNNLAPRLGFSYDIGGDGKTVVKGSFGIYYDAMLAQYFSQANPNGFSYFYGPWDPETLEITSLEGFGLPKASKVGYNGIDPKDPYERQFTASIERELFEDWSLAVRGIYNKKVNILEEVDAASLDMDALLKDGSLVWTNWREVPVTDPVTGNVYSFWEKINTRIASDKVIVNIPQEARSYKALEVVLKKRFSKGWMLEASYVLSKLEGFIDTNFDSTTSISNYYNDPNYHVNAIGRLSNDRRHYLKLLAMVRGPWGINISGVAQYYTGNPYSRLLSSTQEKIRLNGLSSAYIIAGARGEYELPDRFMLDLSLEKEFKIKNMRLALFANAFNLLNQGVATSVYQYTSSKVRSFGQMLTINAPFYLRVGARFDFN